MVKEQYPRFVYDKSGQLYEVASADDSDSEIEVIKKTKKLIPKKQNKLVSKLSIDSSDSEVEVRKKLKKNSPKKKSPESNKRPRQEKKKKSTKKDVVNKQKKTETDSESDPDEEDYERLKKAKDEILTDKEMKEKTEKEMERKYKQSKQYVKWYEKEYLKVKEEEKPLWEQASRLMTEAAATYVKFKGLQKADIKPDSHLAKAIPALRLNGEAKFKKSLEMVSQLNSEDLAKYWKDQERNKDARFFEELVTKKEFELRKLQALSNAVAIENMKIAEKENDPEIAEKDPEVFFE